MQLKFTHYDLIRKVMRISAIQLTMALVLGSMAMARDNFAQEALNREVSLHLKEVSLLEALKEIETEAKVKFVYSRNFLDLDQAVSIDASKQKLGDLLSQLLLPRTIKFTVQDATDFIVLTEYNKPETSITKEMEAATAQTLSGVQLSVVTGTITSSSDKMPMPGVNVVVKGTTNGTTTDAEGKYSISVQENDVLVFSFIGYKSFETNVGGRTQIDVALQEDVAALDEVVVIGYGTTTKRLKTASVARVTDEDISKQPVINPLAALEGRMAGVDVTQNTGTPGGSFSVQVRGRNSIAGNQLPFYVVDGVPFTATPMGSLYSSLNNIGLGSPLATINPADIESIEVLKDADATAIYGSRGANGVVLITTKKGKAGETKVDVNVYQGVQQVSRKMDMLNTQQYLTMRKEAFKNDGATMDVYNAYDLLSWDTTRYTDWQKLLVGGTAHTTDVQASISGGTTNTQFLIGGGFHNETTVFPGDFSYKKGSARINLTHTSTNQKFKAIFTGSFVTDNNVIPYQDPSFFAFQAPPNAPAVYDAKGNLNWDPDGNFYNPIAYMLQKYKAKTDNIVSNLRLSYKILPGLEVKGNFGYTSIFKNDLSTNPVRSQNPLYLPYSPPSLNASANYGNGSIKTWIIEPQVEYQKNIGLGKITALAGATFQQDVAQRQDLSGTGFSNEALIENVGAASTVKVQGTNYTLYHYAALFGRINFDWAGKYIVNLTGRRDGSSRFGPNKQFANFGAVGAAWIFSKEDFFANSNLLKWISFGKIRGSYGLSGSQPGTDYAFLDLWSPTTYPYQGTAGLYPTRLFNPNLAWEGNTKFEAGLELGLINDKLFLSVSYYQNRSSNQLVGLPLAPTTGFPSLPLYNMPATVQNTGVEIELSSTNLKTNSFTWSTSFNMTIPRNKLVSYPGLANSTFANQYVEGEPLYVYKSNHYTGVDPQTGVYTYQDVDGDGNFTSADFQTHKTIAKDFYGGIQNSLQYKNWRFDFQFQYVKQTGNNYLRAYRVMPGLPYNQPAFVMDRWQKSGDITDIQQFTQDFGSAATSAFYDYTPSDNLVSDASFIRLKNVSLSYTFARKWIEKVSMTNARIYLQGQNLLTFTNYKGWDPESQGMALVPPLRTITVGVQLTF